MQETLSPHTSELKKKGLSFSVLVIIFIAVYSVLFANYWKSWKLEGTPFEWDVNQYYSYLPATFIHHDLNFDYPTNYWLNEPIPGKRLPRATYGMAFMYMPSFLLGYKLAVNAKETVDGYSQGFIDAVHYGSIIYFIASLILLRLILLRYFRELTVGIVLLTIYFGSNLFFYVLNSGEMPHNYLFFLFTLFTWLTLKWHETPKYKYSIFIGIVLGFIALIRPTDLVVALVFILYGVRNKTDLVAAFKHFLNHWPKIALIVAGFLVAWTPQLIYWKIQTGHVFFFSYGEKEGFFFGDPKIIDVLFGYRKGWLLYTPLMIFAIIGMFFSKKYIPKLNIPFIICFLLTVYIVSSWWCWWFGGGFGMRALVQFYVFMAFFLCVFVEKVIDSTFFNVTADRLIKYGVSIAFMLCISLNLIQTYQYKSGMLHHSSMTKEAYWTVFGKFELSGGENAKYWSSLKEPDVEGAIKGNR